MMSEGGGRGVGTELDVPQHTCVYTQTKNTHSHLPGGVVVSDLLKQRHSGFQLALDGVPDRKM